MSGILNRDKTGFIIYAVRDAQIVVKQAKTMEVLIVVKKIGVPLSLSSIGRSTVAKNCKKEFKPSQM